MTSTEIIAYIISIAIPAFYGDIMCTRDTFGTSKRGILLGTMAWGAFGAFGLAYIINTAFFRALDADHDYLVSTLTAPVIEEILKASILFVFIWNPKFRYVVDGAIYGFAVGIGFAAMENLSYVYSDVSGGAISLAISRVLSTALMHAVASAIVGLSLGSLRRVHSQARRALNVGGIFIAMLIHLSFNNIVSEHGTIWGGSLNLDGHLILLIAIGLGIGGGVLIVFLINQELQDEKESFEKALGLHVGVSTGERQAVQNVGSEAMEGIFKQMEDDFGAEKVLLIRRLLATQANIGILQNNLQSPTTERLRKAWEAEIEELKEEVEALRRQLGMYVNSFLNNVFPENDNLLWQQELGNYDPTMVHTFDTFMRVSELAASFTPEELTEIAERLKEIEIFKDVTTANLESLSRAIENRTYPDGEMLFDQGDEGDAMYLIKEGEIDIILVQHDGTEKHLKYLGEGKVVGEFSVLDGDTRSARARAKGELTVGVLQRQTFLMFIQSRPHVILSMLKYLAGKARYTTSSVEESIKYAQHIADGEYERLKAMAAATKTIRAISSDATAQEVHEQIDLLGDDGEPTDINEDTAAILCRTFAKVAETIQEQEAELREMAS